MSSKLSLMVGLLGVTFAVGCDGGGGPPWNPNPGPREPRDDQTVIVQCGDGNTWTSTNGGRTFTNQNGQGGWPPCYRPVPQPPNVPNKRNELGLVPDSNGNVAPLIWDTNWSKVDPNKMNVNDRFDLSIATEASWKIPTDSDDNLKASIGSENITFREIVVDPDGLPNPMLVQFYQIKLGDAINLLSQLGHTEITGTLGGKGPYILRLDGPAPDGYNKALIYEGTTLVGEVNLR